MAERKYPINFTYKELLALTEKVPARIPQGSRWLGRPDLTSAAVKIHAVSLLARDLEPLSEEEDPDHLGAREARRRDSD